MTKRAWALIILGGVMLGIAFISTLVFRNSGNITLVIVPSDAIVQVDNIKVSSKTANYSNGQHVIKVSRKGFKDKTRSFIASSDKKTIEIALDTSSAEGVQYLKDHPKEALLRESIIGKESNALGDLSAAKNPVMNLLPYIDREFRIDYGRSAKYPNDPLKIAVVITYTSDQGKQDAMDWLRLKGYDPTQLEIIYN